ncbi:RING finger domain-containingprotein [Paramyrothecium foliicola]|nr:RING finger domain-containingprotein [Paramyrothecium foliicola]
MASFFSLRGFFLRQTAAAPSATPTTMAARMFSTSPASSARQAPKAAPKSSGQTTVRRSRQAPKSENFERIKILKRNMFSPAPPPLRMARQRHLRHWTIHRAWQLFRRQQHEAIEKERMRMHSGMYFACEELRQTVGPPGRGEGYLYRVAMEKKGIYGLGDVPIEYARYQTDFPATKAWDHDWKR